jgi:tetratricopeptide (TPR) repeat protein
MGAVYRAHDRELERNVALKTIRADLAGNAEILQRFKQELILARQVAHRNIVRLYDITDDSGVKFITMEYVEGEDLHAVLHRDGKLSPTDAIGVIRQICMALEAAHGEGIIHRDLKPQNIMRDKQGRIVVMDFGLARALESGGMTQTGAMLGTMEYMSPEQANGDVVDVTSDIYAAGLIFYELLTGKMPYQAESAVASLLKRSQQRALPVSQVDNTIPRQLSAIVARCIEPDRRRRYQHVSQLLADVEAFSPGARSVIRAPAPAALRLPYRWIALAMLVLAVAAGAFFAWRRFARAPVAAHAPVSILVADFTNHTGDPVFDGTLEPMFNVALESASFINAFNRGEARRAARQLPSHPEKLDEQAARLVAVSQDIGVVVTGSLSRRGDGYKITVEALDGASGNTVATAEATAATKDDVLLTIPKLVVPIRKALGDTTPASAQLAATQGGFVVGSLEAAHQYGVGMDQQFAGKMDAALDAFGKATALDANFGRAYSGMAMAARATGHAADAERYFKLAMEHVDRMTERERYRVRGAYYIFTGNLQKCLEEYGALVKLYPSDNIGHNNLAYCYSHLRNTAQAVAEARRSVELNPRGAPQRMNLAMLASSAGDFETAQREAEQALKINPTYEKARLSLADAQVGKGQLGPAAETFRSLAAFSPWGASIAAIGAAELAATQGRYDEAVRVLEKDIAAQTAAKEAERAADDYAALATTNLAWGHTRAAIDAAQHALARSKSVSVRFLAAHVLAEAGETTAARQVAAGLASELLLEPQAYARIIEGEIALQQNDARRALQVLSEAKSTLDTWIGRFDLGRAYLMAGMFAEADSEFDACIRRRGEALELVDDGPTYSFFPPVWYYQGRVREALKSPGAKESYRTYLDLRGQAAQDPLLADTRARAAQ